MQSSGAAKAVPAKMSRLTGIKTQLNSDPNHAGPMKERMEMNWEHFYNHLFTIKRGKICGTGNRFIGDVMQGKMRERCSATILQQLTNEDTEQTCHENKTGKIYNDQIKTLMQFYLKTAPHTQMHTQTKINPDVWPRTFCSQRGR